jgi:Flp pilus assembly pilin Flp
MRVPVVSPLFRNTLRRNTRGATLAEYAIMLFLILVIAAIGFKVLGVTLEKKVGQANKHMTHQEGQTASADNASSAGGSAAAAPSVKPGSSEISKDPTATGGGEGSARDGSEEKESSLPMIARFALLALGVIGAAAAFFAISKGKPAA